jgi:hypothetical protein
LIPLLLTAFRLTWSSLALVEIAVFRDMVQTASIDAVSVKLGGGVAALEAPQVSRDQCPVYSDLQPSESAELVSDVPESNRNRLQRVWPKVGYSVDETSELVWAGLSVCVFVAPERKTKGSRVQYP